MLRATPTLLILLTLTFAPPVARGWNGDRNADWKRRETKAATTLEERLFTDAADQRLDQFGLLSASLIAGGVERETELQRLQDSLAAAREKLRGRLAGLKTNTDRARTILEFLHRDLLRRGRYRADCTEVQRGLTDGTYNCVTATVLFQCLCESFDVPAVAVAVPAHVFSRLHNGSESIDVETTCADWFDVIKDPKRYAETLKSSPHLRDRSHRDAREIGNVELVAKIYYNRGVTQLERHQFAEALATLRKSLRLDPHDPMARDNLLAGINNWALAKCDAGRHADAIQLLLDGMHEAPAYNPFQVNDLYVHHTWTQQLCRSGQHAAAIQVLEDARRRRPEAELFDSGRFTIYRDWAASLFQSGLAEQAWSVLAEARERNPERPELLQCEAEAIARGAVSLRQRGQTELAIAVVERGLRFQPESVRLQKCRQDLTRTDSQRR